MVFGPLATQSFDCVWFGYPTPPQHAHPSSPRFSYQFSRYHPIRPFLFVQIARAYPLANRSFVLVVQIPYHRVGSVRRTISTNALQGFSSVWPLSFIDRCSVRCHSLSGIIPMGSSPIGLHSTHPAASLPLFNLSPRPPASRSYSVNRSDSVTPFKRAAQVVLRPFTPLAPPGVRSLFSAGVAVRWSFDLTTTAPFGLVCCAYRGRATCGHLATLAAVQTAKAVFKNF